MGSSEFLPSDLHRAIIEQTQDAVIYCDRGGSIRLWNRGAEIIFGYAEREVLARDLSAIIPERFWQEHTPDLSGATSPGSARHKARVLSTRATHKFGSLLYVELRLELLRDDAGKVLGTFAIARDCTPRHQALAARRTLADMQFSRQ